MISANAEVFFPCPRCGAEGQLRAGQLVFREELRWYESVNCDKCGLRTESDGIGFPPVEIRERIVATNMPWILSLQNVKSIPAVAKVLREHLSLGTKEVMAIFRAKKDVVIYRGTNAEALWLSLLLRQAGEDPQVSAERP